MIIGMDFGTTNSGMATFDGRAVDVLPLDPTAPNPRVARTALYITNEQAVTIGRAAVDRYFEHNIGRPMKMQKVWVGEIEVVGAEMYFVRDVYVFADALSPGRLFLSIKTGLRDVNYPGTVIGQFWYSLEDLIALYLTVTRARAERLLGQEVRQVVLGRPVHFAADEAGDRLAEARLLHAAFRAGYETVYLQYEPVAAAHSYALGLARPENALVFDFGGGTLDITVMRLGEGRPRVLATGGIPIAGDVFDQKLVRAKLPRHFGEGSFYGPRHKALTVPHWIYDSFADWQTILQLQSAENKQILREIAQTAQRKHQIEALLALVSGNYGLKMFDVVEGAKRVLSEKRGAEIALEGPGFNVREFVTRGEFEGLIRGEARAIEQHLLETVAASGLRPEQIDIVIRTGGSALIPVFHEMLGRHFGEAKVRTIDTFSSVTAGLGVIGHRLEQGEIDLHAHTPADFADLPPVTGGGLKVRPVNLDLLQRRIRLEEQGGRGEGEKGSGGAERRMLVLLSRATTGENARADIIATSDDAAIPADLSALPIISALRVPPDNQLLLITSRYRFLLVTARQLAELREAGLDIENIHRFAARETIVAITDWAATREQERLLLVTSTGYARAYPLDSLRPAVEAPVPLTFDDPPPGVPVLAQGVERGMDAVIVTEGGRGVRWPLSKIPLTGIQALNPGRDGAFDRVTAALAVAPDDEVILLLDDGYARRMKAAWVSEAPRANAKARALVVRKAAAVGLCGTGALTTVTNRRLVAADGNALPLEDSTKAFRLAKLEEEELVTAVVRG
ncbi:MAG TPA: Hsp70 family protein [Promineifilum sp.]|nr:Hsp70 family protein [Promineifilum sp.]HRO90497.1 Hsp70 family protein [Promineifilum sp.]HRQ13439.1 Hsp70 family protein [Promineifilum sp.]